MSQSAAERNTLLSLIADCKAAVNRRADSSDSDETEVAYGTNRGNKLKRRARQVRAGNLDKPTGPKLTTETIEFNGRNRKIIYRNQPKRFEPEERPATTGKRRKAKQPAAVEEDGPSEEDPYAGIQIENILAPPNEPKDIPNHPALSIPYKSHTLTELCRQSLEIICAEHRHVTEMKSLLTHFLGDNPFATGDTMETVAIPKYIQAAQRLAAEQDARKKEAEDDKRRSTAELQTQSTIPDDDDVEMVDGVAKNASREKSMVEGTAKSPIPKLEHPSPPDGFADAAEPSAPTRMTTRSSQNPPSVTTDPNSTQTTSSGIDPHELINSTSSWFYPPEHDENARNFGLNPLEAEETRQLLLLAVQKEDEFIRGLIKVREGLLKAQRLRNNVWEWCRADGAPDMSDGEDYVDLERWGLEEGDLQKGVEEEEEEDTRGKKTTRGGRRN